MRILLVEDDLTIGDALYSHLCGFGHSADWFKNLEDAGNAVKAVNYDLMLLDLRLPDGNGLDLLKEIRSHNRHMPVIILTAHDQISERIAGLNAGADDYLIKPFDLDELTARINAVMRRYEGRSSPLIRFANLEIDQSMKRLTVDGGEVQLSSREWAVLEKLVERPGAIISKDQLSDTLYNLSSEIESNTVEVYISRLRKRIGVERIQTIRGLGYKLV